MDLTTFVAITGIFTIFGYIWGRGAAPSRKTVEKIVESTMDNLETQGYLKTKVINGQPHYLKWPSESNNDSNT